jgi:hypothetical protein
MPETIWPPPRRPPRVRTQIPPLPQSGAPIRLFQAWVSWMRVRGLCCVTVPTKVITVLMLTETTGPLMMLLMQWRLVR